jgi:serine/threonine protein phosphatase PrpC
MKYLYLQGLRWVQKFTDDHTFVNHDVKLGNMTPEKSLTYPRRNVLAHFIGFIDYVFPEVMLGDLSSGELNDMFEELSPQKQL